MNDFPAARGAIVSTRPCRKHARKKARWKSLRENLELFGVIKSTTLYLTRIASSCPYGL